MKNEKNYMGFVMIKIWQILKHFYRALSWAQTSYFWRVEWKEWKNPQFNFLSQNLGLRNFFKWDGKATTIYGTCFCFSIEFRNIKKYLFSQQYFCNLLSDFFGPNNRALFHMNRSHLASSKDFQCLNKLF